MIKALKALRKVTALPSFSCTHLATGAKEYFATALPSGRPKWEHSTTDLQP